ncbi:MAG: HAD-IA family hydrolase [Myxococcota bacterium]
MSSIQAVVFDLDGTLVQTESLKADSYHAVLAGLLPDLSREDVHAAYAEVVGRSGEEVARFLVARFALPDGFAEALGPQPGEDPWQTFYRVRKTRYTALLAQEHAIRKAACPFSREVLEWSHNVGLSVGLATMSHRPQVQRVLDILDMTALFDRVLTRDDVTHGKPDPAIYHLAFEQLGVPAAQTLILEDSPSGARAAAASGAQVLVVVNSITQQAVHRAGLEPDVLAVVRSDPALLGRVREIVGR